MSEKKYYCFCSSNCRYETMTKEQILAAIEQAVNGGVIGDVDAGFITKVKEKNGGNSVTFWVGTQAQYNAIAEREQNCLYIITDETTFDDVVKTVEQAAADAAAAAESAKAKDISAQVDLSVSYRPSSVKEIRIEDKKYVYLPSMGIVFFELSVMYKGKMNAGAWIDLKQSAYPAANVVGIPVLCRGTTYAAEYADDTLTIRANKEYDADDTWGDATICGWYFCNGEG